MALTEQELRKLDRTNGYKYVVVRDVEELPDEDDEIIDGHDTADAAIASMNDEPSEITEDGTTYHLHYRVWDALAETFIAAR